MLILPIKKKWFDMVERREKKEEYRDDTLYWRSRFLKLMTGIDMLGKHHKALLRNGYGKDKPTLEIEFIISFGEGREEWGARQRKPSWLHFISKMKYPPNKLSFPLPQKAKRLSGVPESRKTLRGEGATKRQCRRSGCEPTRVRVATKEGCR